MNGCSLARTGSRSRTRIGSDGGRQPARRTAALLGLAVLAFCAAAPVAAAQTPAIEPAAIAKLERMTKYLGGLQAFSVRTQNVLEEVLPSEQKLQYDYASVVTVKRPDKLRAERAGDLVDQVLTYDGKKLAIHNRDIGYYAVVDAPPDIDSLLVFARENLDLVPPSSDLIRGDAFAALTAPLIGGFVVGKSVVGGVKCDHLAFRTPLVDWQIWIADGNRPLPMKYVITTRGDPAKPQYMATLSDWDVNARPKDALFTFAPPKDAREVEFVTVDVETQPGQ